MSHQEYYVIVTLKTGGSKYFNKISNGYIQFGTNVRRGLSCCISSGIETKHVHETRRWVVKSLLPKEYI